MTDEEKVQLLRLIHKYLEEYSITSDSVYEMVEDLAMSMDITTDEADRLRVELEGML